MADVLQSCCPLQGSDNVFLMKTGTGDVNISTGSERYLLDSATNGPEHTLIQREVTLGDRMRVASQAAKDIHQIRRTISLKPTWKDLNNLWPRIIGSGAKTASPGNMFTPNGQAPPLFCYAEGLGGKNPYWKYTDCQISQATLSGRTGEFVTLELEILARGLAKVSSDIPSVAIPPGEGDEPIVFSKSELQLGASGSDDYLWCFGSFQLTVNNNLVPKYYNHLTMQCVAAGQRVIQLQLETPWNADSMTKLYGTGGNGVSGRLEFTGSANALGSGETYNSKVLFGAMKWPDTIPASPNLQDVNHQITAEVFATGNSGEYDIEVYHKISAD